MSAEAFVAATRAALGLERRELDGLVYFVGGGQAEACPTLGLLHGANDHAGTWAAIVPLLSQYHLIVPDLAGHGESEPKTGPIAMPLIVDRLHRVFEAHCGTGFRLSLVGNSMGAWIALLYALRHPDRVERLVLESGGGLARPLGVPLVATNRDDAMVILRAVHGPSAALPDWAVDALLRRAVDAPMLRLTEHEFIDGRLGEVKAPATLVWGEHDGVVPRAYMEALRDGISGARLEVIEGAAHIPHAQQPARFVSCLTATS